MWVRGLVWLLLAGSLRAQQPNPHLAGLPEHLQAPAVTLLGPGEDAPRVLAARTLGSAPARPLGLLLGVLEQEPSAAVRREIVDRIGRVQDPRVVEALERRITADPDAAVSILAMERLRVLQAQANLALFEKRLRQAGEAERPQLAAEHERTVALARGGRLPAFFHTAPPVFAVRPADRPVRVLAFGDYGQGTPAQQQVAQAMLRYHRQTPFDFAITLGDNFYPRGMESPTDPRWKTLWDELYDPLGIRFYVSLGNHDWGQPDSPAAELLYTHRSPSWRMPATRYTFTAGPVQFFAIDSQAPSLAQWRWLDQELGSSTARWKIVYGHHPIYSHGAHGDTGYLIHDLLPLLRHRADAYFAGHEHDLQHLQPEDGVHLFISGGGGAGKRPVTPGPRSLWAASSYGFAVLDADAGALKVSYFDTELQPLYDYTMRK